MSNVNFPKIFQAITLWFLLQGCASLNQNSPKEVSQVCHKVTTLEAAKFCETP